MKKHTRIGLMILVTVILLLVLTIPGLAKKPDKFFTLQANYTVDWTNLTMYNGSFSSEGAIEDHGDSWGHWALQPGVRTGMVFFVSEEDGDKFVIQFKNPYFELDEEYCVDGTFTIYSYLGTGDYEGVWGTGTLTTCRPDMGDEVYTTLEGRIP